MDILRGWVRSIVCYLCFIQLIDQLLPEGGYRKYVRFFGGLLLIILTISPFMDISGLSKTLEQEWRQAALQEEWASLNLEQEGLVQLREQTISDACRKELERQVEAVAEGNGMLSAKAEVTFTKSQGKPLELEGVIITGDFPEEGDAAEIRKAVKEELGMVYQLPKNCVSFEGGQQHGR